MNDHELRDHFAGLAMNGMLSACQGYNANPSQVVRIACSAYQYADEMMKAKYCPPEVLQSWKLKEC